MHDCYVLYGLTASGCVAKVVCGPRYESGWTPVSTDVYCALRWVDGDSRVHAHAQLKVAANALERAHHRLAPHTQLRKEVKALHAGVLALLDSPPLGWCDKLVERVRAGPLSPLERFALMLAGLD